MMSSVLTDGERGAAATASSWGSGEWRGRVASKERGRAAAYSGYGKCRRIQRETRSAAVRGDAWCVVFRVGAFVVAGVLVVLLRTSDGAFVR